MPTKEAMENMNGYFLGESDMNGSDMTGSFSPENENREDNEININTSGNIDDMVSKAIHLAGSERKLLLTSYRGAKAAFMIEDDRLTDIRLETPGEQSRIGHIYVGKIKSVADGIGAAFVEYEKGNVGFLPLSQISPEMILNRDDPSKITGEQELLVQVFKDPMKHKDATLTTDLLFSGKYLILTPVSRGIRFSRKLKKDEKRQLLSVMENVLRELFGDERVFLERYGLIVRTNALYAGFDEFLYELHELFHAACSVMSRGKNRTAFSLLYQDAPFYQRVLRDQYDIRSIKIYTDDEKIRDMLTFKMPTDQEENISEEVSRISSKEYERFTQYAKTMGPDAGRLNVNYWDDENYGLLERFNINSSVEKALSKRVWLKSGAFLVIEPTEALTVIDVNSGKAASAEAMADSTSSAVQQGTSAITSPVLESVTGIHLSVLDSLHSPYTQYFFLSSKTISSFATPLYYKTLF